MFSNIFKPGKCGHFVLSLNNSEGCSSRNSNIMLIFSFQWGTFFSLNIVVSFVPCSY